MDNTPRCDRCECSVHEKSKKNDGFTYYCKITGRDVGQSHFGRNSPRCCPKRKGNTEMNRDFSCDTEECIYWSEEEGCTKKTAITIQEHCCCDFEEKHPVYEYALIAGLPPLLSEVFVTVSGGHYYRARLLGYGPYDRKRPDRKTYCVEVFVEDCKRHVDFFENIYSRWEVNKDGETP